MSTRAEAAEYLGQLQPSKAALLAAARELDIAVYDRDSIADLKQILIHGTVGVREDAEAIQNWRDTSTTPENAPVVPAVPVFSDNPRKPNTWGGYQEHGAHTFHPDGAIGSLIGQPETGNLVSQTGSIPRDQLALEVRGDSLENTLGNLATETMAGRMSPQQQLDELKAIAAELPAGQAKSAISRVVADLDVPRVDFGQRLTPEAQTALTRFPAVRALLDDLNEIPIARGGYIRGDSDDTREIDRITDALNQFGRAELGGSRFITAIESATNLRHESREGKAAIDRAVQKAVQELTGQQKADRNLFYPPKQQDSPPQAAPAAASKDGFDADKHVAALDKHTSTIEGRKSLDGLSRQQLTEIAQAAGVATAKQARNKQELIDSIIWQTIAARGAFKRALES